MPEKSSTLREDNQSRSSVRLPKFCKAGMAVAILSQVVVSAVYQFQPDTLAGLTVIPEWSWAIGFAGLPILSSRTFRTQL